MDDFENPSRGRPELSQPCLLSDDSEVVSVASANWGWVLLDAVPGGQSPFPTLLLAVLLTGWYGGNRPTLAAVMLGGITMFGGMMRAASLISVRKPQQPRDALPTTKHRFPKPAIVGVWSTSSADLEPPLRFLRIGM